MTSHSDSDRPGAFKFRHAGAPAHCQWQLESHPEFLRALRVRLENLKDEGVDCANSPSFEVQLEVVDSGSGLAGIFPGTTRKGGAVYLDERLPGSASAKLGSHCQCRITHTIYDARQISEFETPASERRLTSFTVTLPVAATAPRLSQHQSDHTVAAIDSYRRPLRQAVK